MAEQATYEYRALLSDENEDPFGLQTGSIPENMWKRYSKLDVGLLQRQLQWVS
jgi:hypothetical protein